MRTPDWRNIDSRRAFFLRHARGPLGGLALVLLCCTVYLPGFFTIPPVDRDESRFAQASRQMFESVALPEGERDPALHSGGLAVPMVAEKPRLNKPPLIYWLQAGSAAVLTGRDPLEDAIWMYRVPSLVAGLVIVLATWRIGCSMFDPRVGWVGACLLAVSPVFVWEAHQARSDMVMVAWTVLAMGQLWRIWRRSGPLSRGPRKRAGERAPSAAASFLPPLLLWGFVALGILTKGPITPMVVALTALWLSAFSRDWRWLRATRPVVGLVIVAAAVGPWVWAVAEHVGFSRYWSIVYDEVLGRAGSAKEGHWGPPGYHIVLLVVLFWPGSLLTGLAIGLAWRRGFVSGSSGGDGEGDGARLREPWHTQLRRAPAYLARLRAARRPEAFLIAWMIPSWIVFEVAGTKLPHYTMPLYPAVALITARGLLAWPSVAAERKRRARLGGWIWLILGLGLTALVGVGVLMFIEGPHAWIGAASVALALVVLSFAASLVRRDRFIEAQFVAVACAVALLLGFLFSVAPGLFGLAAWTNSQAQALASGRPVTWVGFSEDSVTWFARGRPSFTSPRDLPSWFSSHPDGVAVVSVYAEDSYLTVRDLEAVEHAFGVHYAKGRLEKLAIVRRVPRD